ncbi:hypothetical protein GBAR_LOCUS15100 [Geodia barretti]|uniref:YHYH domain-containing protein n=1 Tax=Geodia barretti TaxID=519541 RepID=A0AA35SA38_GEOBA|nr:hypothetical protein GBAR_LOCUS15100 [Geodia barretti]
MDQPQLCLPIQQDLQHPPQANVCKGAHSTGRKGHRVFNNITYLKEDPRPIFGAIGVLINGVEVFGVGSPCGFSSLCPDAGAPTEYVDAVESEGHTVDPCAGHAAPTGSYHIHSGLGINTTEQREACRLPVDINGEHSQLLGWMFDGFGFYGRYSLEGKVPTDLDECSGHTHEIDGESTYHYHLPDQFPWTIGCYKGCPEVSNNENELRSIESNPDYGCPEGVTMTEETPYYCWS